MTKPITPNLPSDLPVHAMRDLRPSQKVANALYNFPMMPENYVLVGSGPMALRDMREVGDLDIFCTTADWFRLANSGWEVTTTKASDPKRRCDPPIVSRVLAGIEVNCFFDWRIRWGGMLINVTEEIADAEFLTIWSSTPDGRDDHLVKIPSMRLERLIAWKHSAGRDKDFRDIAQIAAYLTRGDDDGS